MRLLGWSLIEYQFDKPDAVDPPPPIEQHLDDDVPHPGR